MKVGFEYEALDCFLALSGFLHEPTYIEKCDTFENKRWVNIDFLIDGLEACRGV